MNLRVVVGGEAKVCRTGAGAKASLKRAPESLEADVKPSDLHMSRMKSR